MLLRRISSHVKEQNWFAVFLDFFIVVVGILIAFQITSWNEARSLRTSEKEFLTILKNEIENDIAKAEYISADYANVHAAAKRSLAFMDSGNNCGKNCWPALADFFHASQWFPVVVSRSTFDDMRRQGFPQSREVVEAVELYLAENYINGIVLNKLPAYRELVRSLVPLEVHEAYWADCWEIKQGIETIRFDDCPQTISNAVAAQAVQSIFQNEDIRPSLTFWFSEITPTAGELEDQNLAAKAAIAEIDKALAAN